MGKLSLSCPPPAARHPNVHRVRDLLLGLAQGACALRLPQLVRGRARQISMTATRSLNKISLRALGRSRMRAHDGTACCNPWCPASPYRSFRYSLSPSRHCSSLPQSLVPSQPLQQLVGIPALSKLCITLLQSEGPAGLAVAYCNPWDPARLCSCLLRSLAPGAWPGFAAAC